MSEQVSGEAQAAYDRIYASDDFGRLRKAYLGFVMPMTVAFLAWYVLYVLCSNYAPGLMNARLFGNINVALVWGLLQFVTTFGIAYWYARYSAKKMDPIADALRDEFEAEVGQ